MRGAMSWENVIAGAAFWSTAKAALYQPSIPNAAKDDQNTDRSIEIFPLPPMLIPHRHHHLQNIIPSLLIHHHRVGEHATIPADVLESFQGSTEIGRAHV